MKQNNAKRKMGENLLGDGFMGNLVILVENVETEKRRRRSPREQRSQSHPHYVPHR